MYEVQREGGGGEARQQPTDLNILTVIGSRSAFIFFQVPVVLDCKTALRKISEKTFQRIKILARKRVALVFAALLIDCTAMLYKENYAWEFCAFNIRKSSITRLFSETIIHYLYQDSLELCIVSSQSILSLITSCQQATRH